MRSLTSPIWDLWNNAGPFLGVNKPNGYVTVEFGWMLRESVGPVGDRDPKKLPIRWFQLADNSQVETILPNVKTVAIDRSIDQDAATCDIDIYNTSMVPQGLLELGNPGYFTFGRGSHPDSFTRWGHTPNEWSDELTPNALIRTYEGYGGWNEDGTQMPLPDALAAGFVKQTGAWLVDECRPETDAMLHIKCRDVAKLLIDQPIFPPLVPWALYPLQYARFYWRHVSTPYIAYGTAANGVKFILGIIADATDNDGYWLIGDDGGVFTYGNTDFYGSLAGDISHGIIGGARSFTNKGYWLAAFDGTVFAFGDAIWHGGYAPATGQTMVAIESIKTSSGYYLCDTAGDVYTLGDVDYHGGGPGTTPIAAMAVMPDGSGYWLMDDTGHVYSYGAAMHYGNGDPLVASTYTAMEATPTGLGYYLVTEAGHVYAMGDAVYHGGTAGMYLNDPISDIALRPDGAGYWLVALDGGVFTFGQIPFYGSLPGATENDYPYDGNYFDYADIVKDLLLWCGFWLNDGGVSPDVFGAIESTGAYGPERLPMDMFDKKAPMAAITQIKEIVAYITWVDADGAFHFESPNWWYVGNYLPNGTHTDVLPEIDERVQLINYGVSADDKAARDRVIITDTDPAAGDVPGSHTTTVVQDAPQLRGLLKPAMWSNGILTKTEDQQVMATLLGKQLMFRQRVGSVVCWANPEMEVNDQCRIWERQTDEVFDHYIRGLHTDHDFETGQYTMRLTTHWLGRDWGGRGPDRVIHAGSVRSSEEVSILAGVSGAALHGYPISISSSEAVAAPTVVGPQQRSAGAVSSSEAFGAFHGIWQQIIAPQSYDASGGFSLPVVIAPGSQTVLLQGLASAAAFGLPFIPGAQSVDMAGLASGFAAGLPDSTFAAFVDDFADLSNWSAGGFSISPAGFAYQFGDGSATGMAMHAKEAGVNYVEALVYGDATGGDVWGVIKLNTSGGAGYDGNGAGALVRSSDGQIGWIAAGAFVTYTAPGWTGYIATPPRSLATAVLLGIHKTGAGTYDLYVNRVKVQTVAGVTNDGGGNIGMCAYNGMGLHVDYVATATSPLGADPR